MARLAYSMLFALTGYIFIVYLILPHVDFLPGKKQKDYSHLRKAKLDPNFSRIVYPLNSKTVERNIDKYEIKIDFTDLKVEKGLSVDQVIRELLKHSDKIKNCYMKRVDLESMPQDKLTISMFIGASGASKVFNLSIKSGSISLQPCIVGIINSVKFAKRETSEAIKVVFSLRVIVSKQE